MLKRLRHESLDFPVDLLASSEREVRSAEVCYTFGLRRRGESKLDVNTAVAYHFLILDLFTWYAPTSHAIPSPRLRRNSHYPPGPPAVNATIEQ